MSDLNFIVITGVTKGLGKALAEQFLQHGVKVVGCARNAADSDFQHENLTIDSVDVTNAQAMNQWAKKVMTEHGLPDVVLQSAGTVNAPANIEDINPELVAQVMNVNFMGVVYGMQAFLPAMKEAAVKEINKGFIINISSGWGRAGKEGLAPYCASKFAVEGLVDSVARELNGAVKVYALDPGDGIQTDMLNVCLPSYYPDAPKSEDWAACAYDYIQKMWQNPPSECSLTVDLSNLPK
ncbi:SDR family NAD(P)-dependent oxidoreductase [Paraneptunicella aestuarii]|uniref:SDR family oxidoreductase n=1 Tax=Paraneptunicella aestuarii TaxID=2831148 RepID=UPI001E3A6FA9|nr:SDR family NAD(P)-dependent oxidoreductase [Paraneptunicella aestuarii]UAA38018.1 SDR family NAD(P)-dependent oxidoreductase [Paraneptunicella aestuarii]